MKNTSGTCNATTSTQRHPLTPILTERLMPTRTESLTPTHTHTDAHRQTGTYEGGQGEQTDAHEAKVQRHRYEGVRANGVAMAGSPNGPPLHVNATPMHVTTNRGPMPVISSISSNRMPVSRSERHEAEAAISQAATLQLATLQAASFEPGTQEAPTHTHTHDSQHARALQQDWQGRTCSKGLLQEARYDMQLQHQVSMYDMQQTHQVAARLQQTHQVSMYDMQVQHEVSMQEATMQTEAIVETEARRQTEDSRQTLGGSRQTFAGISYPTHAGISYPTHAGISYPTDHTQQGIEDRAYATGDTRQDATGDT